MAPSRLQLIVVPALGVLAGAAGAFALGCRLVLAFLVAVVLAFLVLAFLAALVAGVVAPVPEAFELAVPAAAGSSVDAGHRAHQDSGSRREVPLQPSASSPQVVGVDQHQQAASR